MSDDLSPTPVPAATPAAAAAAPDFTHVTGLDWASDHHDDVVVDACGTIVLQVRSDDTADGWGALAQGLAACGAAPAHTAVARCPECGMIPS